MSVFYPFGIPTTSSFAETASFAFFTDELIETASFAIQARLGPTGSKGIDAGPADCIRLGAEFKEFPEVSEGLVIPVEVVQARNTYILCVETTTGAPFIVPAILDGAFPNTIFITEISGGTPLTQFFLFADGGGP
jgi:hypothetical protein